MAQNGLKWAGFTGLCTPNGPRVLGLPYAGEGAGGGDGIWDVLVGGLQQTPPPCGLVPNPLLRVGYWGGLGRCPRHRKELSKPLDWTCGHTLERAAGVVRLRTGACSVHLVSGAFAAVCVSGPDTETQARLQPA